MELEAVFLDVGETLVNEDRYWREVAAAAGLEPYVVTAALGVTIARGEDHTALWSHLGVERPSSVAEISYSEDDLRWWGDRIGEWSAQGRDVFAYFNNDGHGHAVRNALRLKELVGA